MTTCDEHSALKASSEANDSDPGVLSYVFDEPRRRVRVISTLIDVVSWEEAIDRISSWASTHKSRSVCACNAHSVASAYADTRFSASLESADLCVPDGAPIAWMLRRLDAPSQRRISGPDLMWRYFEHAEKVGHSIFLYGSDPLTISFLQERIAKVFPGLIIAGSHSPPFRELTSDEDAQVVDLINRSGAHTVWVSLGCPRQEIWISEHRHKINAVMVGVGAAFNFHARTLARAPEWMQMSGLEWLYRLGKEPRRLWRRYLSTNALFVYRASIQLLRDRLNMPKKGSAI